MPVLFFEVILDPVVKTIHFGTSGLAHKNVFESTGVLVGSMRGPRVKVEPDLSQSGQKIRHGSRDVSLMIKRACKCDHETLH